MTGSQIDAMLALAAGKISDPHDAGISGMTLKALRRKGWAKRTGSANGHAGTGLGFIELARQMRENKQMLTRKP